MDRLSQIFAEHAWYWWIIIGFLAGIIAKAIMPGRDPGGWVVTILLGIAGAFVSAILGDFLFPSSNRGDTTSLLSAIVGSLIILFIYRWVATRRA
jgi:uncharacterized membrane protein YeaQ/YmgE (transglycosylase-associated protein family)